MNEIAPNVGVILVDHGSKHQEANEMLLAAGADLHYQELEDLSHTYPREENAKILDWSWANIESP